MPNDYNNPASIRPQTGPMTNQGLAGIYDIRDRARYEDQARLQDLIMRNEAGKSTEEYQEGYGVRQAERQGKIAQAPLDTTIKQNQADKSGLENIFTRGTQPGKMGVENQSNRVLQGAGQMEELQQGLAIAGALAKVTPGPLAGQQIQQMMQQSGISPNHPVLRQILSGNDMSRIPQQAQQVYQQINEHLQPYRTTMDKEKMSGDTSRDVARINAAASDRRAAAANADKVKTAWTEFQIEGKGAEKLNHGLMLVEDPNVSKEKKDYVKAVLRKLQVREDERVAGQRVQQLPGFPQMTPMPDVTQEAGAPQPGGGAQRWGRDKDGKPVRIQ